MSASAGVVILRLDLPRCAWSPLRALQNVPVILTAQSLRLIPIAVVLACAPITSFAKEINSSKTLVTIQPNASQD
jgi:hypothetical protein